MTGRGRPPLPSESVLLSDDIWLPGEPMMKLLTPAALAAAISAMIGSVGMSFTPLAGRMQPSDMVGAPSVMSSMNFGAEV